MVTAVLAAVFALGLLAGAGAALPWPQSLLDWREARQVRVLADAARAEQLFILRFRLYTEGGWRPAHPLSQCEACLAVAADQGLAQAEARRRCGAACGVGEGFSRRTPEPAG